MYPDLHANPPSLCMRPCEAHTSHLLAATQPKAHPGTRRRAGQLSRNWLTLSSYIRVRGPHRGSSDAPQHVDEYFVRVLHPLSQVVQHPCAMCSTGVWHELRLSTYVPSFFAWNSSLTLTKRVHAQDGHKMRTSSCLGQISKLPYVMIRGTEVVNKGDE